MHRHSFFGRNAKALALLSCFFVWLSMPLSARQRWICVSTAHFEMYTDNNEKLAIAELQHFEQVRYFFLKVNARQHAPEGRVRIIAFSSEKAFKPYRFNSGAFAYYRQSHERDYIVMQDIEPEHSRTAVHEYTHLVVQHLKLELPVWLNEGLADVYSSLEPDRNKALVGRPLPERTVTLSSQTWMDWNVLLNVDQNSPYYNDRDKMPLFYAQSWALAHMLNLGVSYSSKFTKFLAAVANGSSSAQALDSIYGKSVEEVGHDVEKYVRRATVRGAVFDVDLPKGDLEPRTSELSQLDVDLALADLLATNPKTSAQAKERLLVLEKENPNNNEVELSMGYLAWQENHLDEARQHFRMAIDHGVTDPNVIFRYAQLLQGTDTPAATQEGLLRQVVAQQPDNLEARLLLASSALNAGHYAFAVATLLPIHEIQPANAFEFFYIDAAARTQLKEYEGAKKSAKRALTYAKGSDRQLEVANLLAFLDRATEAKAKAVPASETVTAAMRDHSEPMSSNAAVAAIFPEETSLPRVHGTTTSFDCIPGGGYQLRLQVGTREMIFAMPKDPKDVLVRNTPDATALFTCGPLKPEKLTVLYKPAGQSHVDGIIYELLY